MENKSRLVPILRGGVDVIKMILFKKLKLYLTDKYADLPAADISPLTGAMVNDLFGTPNSKEPFASFAKTHQDTIKAELADLANNFKGLNTALSDALRIQYLCDCQEGHGGEAILQQAEKYGILILDREVPLPRTFLEMVRRLGAAFNLMVPPDILPQQQGSDTIPADRKKSSP